MIFDWSDSLRARLQGFTEKKRFISPRLNFLATFFRLQNIYQGSLVGVAGKNDKLEGVIVKHTDQDEQILPAITMTNFGYQFREFD